MAGEIQDGTQTVEEFLAAHNSKDLLRFLTCGSVDDGKSTLIGRLLHDSKLVYEDTLAALKRDSERHGTTGPGEIDYALLVDGLKAEREQGITIDVAYRYFSTPQRKFIIADTPGHEQYTRNMATGASTCDLAVVLIDARYGVITQTKRHSFIASLLGIKHIVVAVNKMDLVDYDESVYNKIREDYLDFSARLGFGDLHFLPISALKGDNVVDRSKSMDWYQGPPLLAHLETVQIGGDRNLVDFRFPVQYVNRPNLNFRGFAGTIASGVVRPGDEIMVLPSKKRSKIKAIVTAEGELQQAFAPQAVTLTLEDEIDASRGDMLVHVNNLPHVAHRLEAMLVWMDEQPLVPGQQYQIKLGTQLVNGVISKVRYQTDINTLRQKGNEPLNLNEIGRVEINASRPLSFDAYEQNRATGSFVLIDRLTNATLAAGMIIDRVSGTEESDSASTNEALSRRESLVNRAQRSEKLGHQARTIWFTGLPKSGKARIALALEKALFDLGIQAKSIIGNDLRSDLCHDLGFTGDDRTENIRRAASACRLLNDSGLVTLAALNAPTEADRAIAENIIGSNDFLEIHVKSTLKQCKSNDDSGIYRRAINGEINNLPGINGPYDPPADSVFSVEPATDSLEQITTAILTQLADRKIIS
ncbi:MAG: sulfate adenylyltransferase subunit CysN [Immundisolibacteraceae bacterium]|nr:sulfate adenylyltransferase subunit CysN [Immundisolibacteraceae bacterium]